jgi:hypothetical protein
MNRTLLLTATILFWATAATQAQDARYKYAHGEDFSKYKTYKWVEVKGSEHASELTQNAIVTAIDNELTAKGLKKTTGDVADLYIGIQAAVGTQRQFAMFDADWSYGPGWGASGHENGKTQTTTSDSTKMIYVGQLALDMYDSGKKELVWRGIISKVLDPRATQEQRLANVDKAVKKLLKNYPPPPSTK